MTRLLLGALIACLFWPSDASAQTPECERYDKILSDLKNAYAVSQSDVDWGLQIERSGRCSASARAAAQRPSPHRTSGPLQCPTGLPLAFASDHPCDLFALAAAYHSGKGVPKDATRAAALMTKAAERGHPLAQFNVALRYDSPSGRPADPVQYLRWMRMAADQGDAMAQERVARVHYYGWGVPVDYAEAARWYARASQNGSVSATTSLAVQYATGEGVPRDRAKAAQLFRSAAERGDDFAQFAIGVAYASADGVPRDLAQARHWLQKAAMQGYDGANERLAAVNTAIAHGSSTRTTTASSGPTPSTGSSLADQAAETLRRQRAENCAAAAAGRDRVCIRD